MANTRPVDKTKKSNIKCEHCAWWKLCESNQWDNAKCSNSKSPKYDTETHYWNRCKAFGWK